MATLADTGTEHMKGCIEYQIKCTFTPQPQGQHDGRTQMHTVPRGSKGSQITDPLMKLLEMPLGAHGKTVGPYARQGGTRRQMDCICSSCMLPSHRNTAFSELFHSTCASHLSSSQSFSATSARRQTAGAIFLPPTIHLQKRSAGVFLFCSPHISHHA